MTDTSSSDTHPRPLWWLPGVAGGAAIGAIVTGLLTMSPMSPLALGLADATLGSGMPHDAVERYEAIGASSPDLDMRRDAYRRAARVYELELDEPRMARRSLLALLDLGVSAAEASDVREQMAELFLSEHNEAAAAHQYKLAYEADPSRPGRLVRAAEVRASRADFGMARNLWRRLLDEAPAFRARANLGLGEVALAQGRPTKALRPFQLAARSGHPDFASPARLGLAACYERLGELDGAMAELDQAALPVSVHERRLSGIIERQAEQNPGKR